MLPLSRWRRIRYRVETVDLASAPAARGDEVTGSSRSNGERRMTPYSRPDVSDDLVHAAGFADDLILGMSCLIQSVRPDGRVLFVNDFWLSTLGYTPEEITAGVSLHEVIAPESQEHCASMMHRVMAGELVRDVRAVFLSKDGRRVHVVGDSNCRMVDGVPLYTRSVFRDVTGEWEARRRLEESEARYRALFERSAAAQFLVDATTGTVLAANESAAVLYGEAAPSSFLGRNIVAFNVDPDPVALFGDISRVSLGQLKVLRRRHRVASGAAREMEIFIAPIQSPDGVLLHAIVHDVTARVEAEAERRRLMSVIDASSNVIVIATLDGCISYINPAGLELLGWSDRRSADGLTTADIIPARVRESVRREGLVVAMREGSWTGDSLLLSRDGEEIPVWGQIIVHRDATQKVEFVSIVVRDMRARRRAEEALRASEQRFRAIFDATYELAGLLAPDGTLLAANRTALELVGCTSDQLVGRKFWDTPWWSESPAREQLIAAVARCASGEPAHFEAEHRGSDGRVVTVAFSLMPVRDDEGRVVLLVPTGHDISDRKEMERVKEEMVGLVSHELRSPLHAILGSLRLLRKYLAEIEGRPQQMLDMATRNAERLLKLVNDLLDLDRIEAEGLPLHRLMHGAWPLIEHACTLVQTVADSAGVTLHPHRTRLHVFADEERITQVLINLISNAVKFSPAGTSVAVDATCDEESGGVRFSIRDRGRGLTAEQSAGLFRRFAQASGEDCRQQRGTGLGLAISRAIVEQHGGRIGVESALGEGSTFWFVLPAHAPAD